MSQPADLGIGKFEVIVRCTNPDGSKEEWTIHQLAVESKPEYNHFATVQVDFEYGEDMDYLRDLPLKRLARAATQTMELHIRGRLEQADPNKDELYRVVTKPAPIICPECVQGKHRNCDGGAWDPAKDEAAPCQCKDETHG